MRVVVIEVLIPSIGDPAHAAGLGQQLSALIRPDLPNRFVLDFHKVKLVGSTAFGAWWPSSSKYAKREARSRFAAWITSSDSGPT